MDAMVSTRFDRSTALRIHSFAWAGRRLHYSATLNQLVVEPRGPRASKADIEQAFQRQTAAPTACGLPEAQESTPIDGCAIARRPLHSLDLVLTRGCSLNCRYCSLYQGRSVQAAVTQRMTWPVARQAVSMIRPQLETGANCRVRFTGGEPLLNRPLMDRVMDEVQPLWRSGRGRQRVFSMVTNGVGLTERVIEHLTRYPIAIQVSLDGPAPTHDAHRRLRGSEAPSHALVERAARALKRAFGELHIAAVWTPGGATILQRIQYFESLGVDRLRMSHCNVQLSGDQRPGPDDDAFATLAEQYDEYARYYLRQGLAGRCMLYDPFSRAVQRLLGGPQPVSNCDPLNTGNRTIDVDGRIYPCYAFAGLPEHSLGSVFQGQDPAALERWSARRQATLARCGDCWAWTLCRGGDLCEQFDFDAGAPRSTTGLCRAQRRRMELALGVYAVVHERLRRGQS